MNKKLNKKAQSLNMLISGAILILIAIITVAIALQINESMGDAINANTCGSNTSILFEVPATCSLATGLGADGSTNNWTCNCAEWNATTSGTEGLAGFANYWVSIVSIIILVVIVGLFAYFRGGTGGVEVQ